MLYGVFQTSIVCKVIWKIMKLVCDASRIFNFEEKINSEQVQWQREEVGFCDIIRMHGRALIQNSTWSERAMRTETVINYAFLRCKVAFERAIHGFLETRHNFTMIIREANGFVVSPSRTNCRIQSSIIDARPRWRGDVIALELLISMNYIFYSEP